MSLVVVNRPTYYKSQFIIFRCQKYVKKGDIEMRKTNYLETLKKVSWVGLFTNIVELFKKCLKEDCFPDCWKVLSVFVIFKNVGEMSVAKNYHSVSLFSLKIFFFSFIFEIFLNGRIVDYLKKCGLFF